MAKKSANGNQSGTASPESRDNNSTTIIDGDVITADGTDSEISGSDNRVINPSDIITGEPDATDGNAPRKRRGRPKGSRNTNTSRSTKEATEDLANLLIGAHVMLAALIQVKELQLEEEEANKLAAAMTRVSKLYTDFEVPEKIMAWGALAFCVVGTYGPRIGAYNLRKKEEKKQKPTVVDVTPISVA